MKDKKPKATIRSKLTKDQVLTIPNILSFARLAMIPLIVWLYCVERSTLWTLAVVLLSGITDIVDGFIARRFHMTSDLGKALDPIADKLTQMTLLICLLTRFPLMWIPLILMLVKESVAFTLRYHVFRRTGEVEGAVWHGKTCTVLLYLLVSLHIFWYDIPLTVSTLAIAISTLMMLFSFCAYTVTSASILRRNPIKSKKEP